jgi:chemotaxis response regulator CheB
MNLARIQRGPGRSIPSPSRQADTRGASEEVLVDTTRVLLVNLPRLLSEILRTAITEHEDLDVAAAVTGDYAQVAALLARVDIDVVVISADNGHSAGIVGRLLDTRPAQRVVVVADDGRRGYVWQPVGELSIARLLEAIRHPMSPD